MSRLSVLLLVIAGVAANLESARAADFLPDQAASAMGSGRMGESAS